MTANEIKTTIVPTVDSEDDDNDGDDYCYAVEMTQTEIITIMKRMESEYRGENRITKHMPFSCVV